MLIFRVCMFSYPSADVVSRSDSSTGCSALGTYDLLETQASPVRTCAFRWDITQFAGFSISKVVFNFKYMDTVEGQLMRLYETGTNSTWIETSVGCWPS